MSKYQYPLTDYLKTINESKNNLMDGDDPGWEKEYPAWVITKCLSHHYDTVLLANEMNLNSQLPSKLQYDFYINIVRKRKRFAPWLRKNSIEDISVIQKYYGYSFEKAQQALKILSKEQIDYIKSKLDQGGKK